MAAIRPNLPRILGALLIAVLLALALHRWGRPLWQPVLAWATGGVSVDERLRQIAATHPGLAGTAFRDVVLIACKQERRLEVWNAGRLWRTFPILAASGGPGPKLRAGDRQVPEGLYHIDAVNPESSYHLSLRVSYPNAVDRLRSQALGISDPGGDIYLHGKAVSIGCLAIGDAAIEEVFYAVCTAGYRSTEVLIAPSDPPRPAADAPAELRELYTRLATEMARVRGGGH